MRSKPILCLATPAHVGALAAPAEATSGLYALDLGLETLAMSGADAAVARAPLALDTNPAGLAQLSGTQIEAQGALVHELGIEPSDPSTDGHDRSESLGYAGRARHHPPGRPTPAVRGETRKQETRTQRLSL